MRIAAAGLLLLVVSCRDAPPADTGTSDRPLHLRVLATHDIHGALQPAVFSATGEKPVGGFQALQHAMRELEAACRCVTVRVDGGDQMQGTLASNLALGAPVVAGLNHLRLDAAAVGNHELDWGVETLLERQREARYAWLAANVFTRADGGRPAWAQPYAILEREGIRVAVVGYATVQTPRTLRPEVTAPYEFRQGYAAIREVLDAVWQERPDFVIVAAHASGDCTSNGCAGEMVDLASELPPGRVHLIAGGHNHSAGEGIVNGIPIVRAGADGRAVAVVDLFRLATGARAFRISRHTVHTDNVEPDAALTELLAPFIAASDAKGREQVAVLAEPLTASAAGDRRLGYLVAEAARLTAGADVGLHNPGGVRADLPRGVVSYTDLHRVLPFGNAIVRLTLTGRQLRELVDTTGPRYYFSNLGVMLADEPGGSRTALAFADGTPVRDEVSYSLATNDFLADGGDGLALLPTFPREATGVTLLDATIERLRSLPSPVRLTESRPLQPAGR
jgi:2',3'-cyclic-nucleotide 2'-phosphodiesterase / 3'-nucleotidase / 5'-nucleotidase